MSDKEKVIKGLEAMREFFGFGLPSQTPVFEAYQNILTDAITLLKEQEQIKSPDEFRSVLLGMFDSIWDVEIDHPIFQDTVGELMEGVLQAYRQAVKWD